eukprot:TRINITY_DN22024_c0_g2_i3.p1 TRINITY_DN22024_c0_g2~~TRINITY_DN22024_c0_g2_i3.p1  ORF type:complete len:295 (+),score=35.22 TRINITY_DN22024_c0_g2_i3:71-955(+)
MLRRKEELLVALFALHFGMMFGARRDSDDEPYLAFKNFKCKGGGLSKTLSGKGKPKLHVRVQVPGPPFFSANSTFIRLRKKLNEAEEAFMSNIDEVTEVTLRDGEDEQFNRSAGVADNRLIFAITLGKDTAEKAAEVLHLFTDRVPRPNFWSSGGIELEPSGVCIYLLYLYPGAANNGRHYRKSGIIKRRASGPQLSVAVVDAGEESETDENEEDEEREKYVQEAKKEMEEKDEEEHIHEEEEEQQDTPVVKDDRIGEASKPKAGTQSAYATGQWRSVGALLPMVVIIELLLRC